MIARIATIAFFLIYGLAYFVGVPSEGPLMAILAFIIAGATIAGV